MKYNEFKTKEEYLTYRSEWKAEYKKLSQEIRQLKKQTRESGHHITWTEYRDLYNMKEKATSMIVELKLAKKEAQRQYEEQKVVTT